MRRIRGEEAEREAARYLEAQGLEVLARNVRCKGGEIDLLCRDGEVLAVIEVRQRSSLDFGGALASVTREKRRRLIRAAAYLLRTSPLCRGRPLRFDVVGIQGAPGGRREISWIKDAFRTT